MQKPEKRADELERAELDQLAVEYPEKCIEAISAKLQYTAPLESTDLGSILVKATGQIKILMDSALAAGDWKAASRHYASLEAVKDAVARMPAFSNLAKIPAVDPALKGRILLSQATESESKGLYAPAMRYFKQAMESAAISGATLREWAERAANQGDSVSFGEIAAKLDPAEIAGIRESHPGLASQPEISSMVSGVVTVYVDKGLKVEGGLGYPDRVVGSAFQIDGAGYYLTNYHVIQSEVDPEYEGYSKLSIRPSGNPTARIPATVVGWDAELDLALIKSEASPYTFHFSAATGEKEGQRVYVIGSPVGLENTVTAGILSAKSRRLLALGDVLQVDASVNPGNSGGPLVDSDGAVIGVVFAGLAGYQGLNFALPAAWIKDEIPLLFEGGKLEHSWLGAALGQNLDSSLDIVYRLPSCEGLQPGDRLVAIDGAAVRDLSDAQMKISQKPLGALVSLSVLRNGLEVDWLGRTSARPAAPLGKAINSDSMENILAGATGMMLQHLSGPHGEKGTYKVVRAWPGLTADESGISAGDTVKFIHYAIDKSNDTISFDLSVKSPATGYLERTMRMEFMLELPNFI
ncbi:MAG: trypsin-like peptidase domain-containing protein [Spirochaetaceae bacterium]|nr:trypsin-like peptidase domain-containing protein [Spirochaetaceae bacterium]